MQNLRYHSYMEAVPGFPTVVANIEGDSKLLFIVLLLGIISWKGVSCFNSGGGDVFQMGGASFLSGGCPWGASVLVGGGVFEKYRKMAGGTPTMGNPACGHYFVQCRFMSLYFLPLWICNFPLSLFNKSPFFVKLITQ